MGDTIILVTNQPNPEIIHVPVGLKGNDGVNSPPPGTLDGMVATSISGGVVYQIPTDVTAAVNSYLSMTPTADTEVDPGYLLLPGDSSKPCARCLVSPAISGDFEVRIDDLTVGIVNSGSNQTLLAIQSSTIASFIFRLNASGNLTMLAYPSPGTTPATAVSSVVYPGGTKTKLRLEWKSSNGRFRAWVPTTNAFHSTTGVTHGSPNQRILDDASAPFTPAHVGMLVYCTQYPDGTTITSYTSATEVHVSNNATGAATGVTYTVGAMLSDGTHWANVGVDQTAVAAGGLYVNSAMPLTIGAVGNGTALMSAGTRIGKVRIYTGIENPDGTGFSSLVLKADPTFSGRNVDPYTFTDTESNVWTRVGNAAIVPISATTNRNGTTAKIAAPALIQATIKPKRIGDYGPLGTANDSPTIQAAIDACYNAGGGVVDASTGGPQLIIGPNTSLLNQITGLPYTALTLKDGVRLEGDGPQAGGFILAAAANCHMIGHPGRLQGGFQDHIDKASVVGLRLDGNKANQDGCHDHDGLRLPQYPGLVVEDVMLQNIDGHGYYSTANGDFSGSISDLGQNTNATVVKPLWLERIWSHDNARWGFFMSATNRKTHENELYAYGNGTALARIVGKKVNPSISAGGDLYLRIDASITIYHVTFAAADNAATICSKINAQIGSAGSATLSSTNRLMISSATTGGFSWVEVYNDGTHIPTVSVLLDLGLARISDNGPLPSTPMHLNGENNSACGANEYGGLFADHSEAQTDGWFAESNLGDGVYTHNVNMCNYGLYHSVSNNGYGAYINELNTSQIAEIIAGMNCVDLGFASYRSRTILNASSVAITTPKAEVLFAAGTVGYGVTGNSVIGTIIAPGIKSSLGSNPDNRHADCSVAIEHGVASTLAINNGIYGPDGGLNGDGLGATIRDYR